MEALAGNTVAAGTQEGVRFRRAVSGDYVEGALITETLSKVMRQIHQASDSDYPLRHIRKLEKQRKKAGELDVLMSGRVNQLLLQGDITQVMATSLINDSEQASKIAHSLIDIATLLYYPKDRLVAELEEKAPAT